MRPAGRPARPAGLAVRAGGQHPPVLPQQQQHQLPRPARTATVPPWPSRALLARGVGLLLVLQQPTYPLQHVFLVLQQPTYPLGLLLVLQQRTSPLGHSMLPHGAHGPHGSFPAASCQVALGYRANLP